jgi:hypothetical protein
MGKTARPSLALSVRQPWAELIMRGEKIVEYRSRFTHVRGRIYIYASEGRYTRAEEAAWAAEYAIDVDALPRGVIVGTVELYDCYGEEWQLRLPGRLARPIAPTRRPNPVWSRPFG